jgi:uncharacterized membrane protein YcaP (DUF421 family)
MTDVIHYIFGQGKDLNPLQMSARAVLISFVCLVLIRFSGRRAFGMGTALDNMYAILLGAILSRPVVGASPFFPTLAAAATIAVLHRLGAWIGLYSHFFGRLVKGEAIVLFENGKLMAGNMKKCRITEKDLMEGIRLNGGVDSLDKVKTVFIERNGKISVIKKDDNL